MIYRPMYVDKIMCYVDTPFVKILTGVRRCGKSTILKMIMEKLQTEKNVKASQIASYRFDSMEYEDMTSKQMYTQLKGRLTFSLMKFRKSPAGKKWLILLPLTMMWTFMLRVPIHE